MASINIDPKVVEFIKSHPNKFGGKSLSVVIAEAILFMYLKKDDCFACPHHASQVSGYYLGMQKKALQSSRSGQPRHAEQAKPVCANCSKQVLRLAKDVAVCSQLSSMAKVVNDALVEYITRPSACLACPFYTSMSDEVAAKSKESSR